MNRYFLDKFATTPQKKINDIFLFNSHDHGDYFEEEDANEWFECSFWKSLQKREFIENKVTFKLIDRIIQKGEPVIDVACGPGMGLIPSILAVYPKFVCLATDACPFVLTCWDQYLKSKSIDYDISFSCFSLMDIPIIDSSVQVFSSVIGLSSTRNGKKGYDIATREIFRVMAPGGLFCTIEQEWTNPKEALKIFEQCHQQPWNCFLEDNETWHDRFDKAGFKIQYEEVCKESFLSARDNELGRMATENGIQVGTKWTAFILTK